MNRSTKISASFGLFLFILLNLSTGCSSAKKVAQGLPEEKSLMKEPAANSGSSTDHAAMVDPAAHSQGHLLSSPGEHTASAPTIAADPTHAVHWSYSGMTGPIFWGNLDPQFSVCNSGTNQSPIDLKWNQPAQNRPLEISYHTSPLRIVDNGHTIQAVAGPGNILKVAGTEYELKQIHFHSPSEHTFSGKHYPMEMHFVHQAKDGRTAVLGRMITVGTKANPFIDKIWSNIPQAKNQEVTVANQTLDFDLALPKSKTYYNYSGSLTTPPCTEGLDWNVLNTPLTISKQQLATFQAIYKDNARPIQQVNNRKPANY